MTPEWLLKNQGPQSLECNYRENVGAFFTWLIGSMVLPWQQEGDCACCNIFKRYPPRRMKDFTAMLPVYLEAVINKIVKWQNGPNEQPRKTKCVVERVDRWGGCWSLRLRRVVQRWSLKRLLCVFWVKLQITSNQLAGRTLSICFTAIQSNLFCKAPREKTANIWSRPKVVIGLDFFWLLFCWQLGLFFFPLLFSRRKKHNKMLIM